VFSNLLNNAAKYTDAGGTVTVTATIADGDVVIAVKDTGRGMSAEMLPRVFDSFTQERQNIDRSRGGLGLGLAIVKSLVELHGGTVGALSSGPGQGSTFWVRVPYRLEQTLPAGALDDGHSMAARGGGGTEVLIVDDNVDAALLLSDLLAGIGYSTRVAHDAPQALAMANEYVPDVALLDIGLPAMDGYELARRLREMPQWRDVRLIAVTGYGQNSDRKRSLEAGFDHHLVKPIALAALQQVIPRDDW
jgi:CheY-like chemotaxis protein